MDTRTRIQEILGTDGHTAAALPTNVSRRNCLKLLTGGALMAASQTVLASTGLSALQALVTDGANSADANQTEDRDVAAKIEALSSLERSISLYNTHTHEVINATFYENGNYDENALNKLNLFLRDHRENEAMVMDKGLFTQMWAIRSLLGSDSTFDIVSGYRTPKTNEYLRSKSGGVARSSLHMLGRAIDLRLRDVPTKAVRDAARQLNAGGVGYYPGSDFVHIDTGEVRHWG